MIHPRELPSLLTRAVAGRLDPDRVAALAVEWNPAVHPPFVQFLVDRGLLPPEAVPRPEGVIGTVDLSTARGDLDRLTPEDEVAALVAGRLDETPTAEASGPGTPRPGGVPDVGPRYRLLKKHRGGGLGEVWLGVDTVLGRPVAVKVLREDRLGLPSIGQRFLAEGKAAGRLEHPNIVPVYDLLPADPAAGRDAAYVMRFVAGRTLAEAARDYHAAPPAGDARTTLAPLLDAFVLVCKAVAFAHSQGVLHRDLKGANIILGEFGEVQLLDWGLAKAMTDPATGRPQPVVSAADSDLTVTEGVVGTPAYLPPEVAAGADASLATDVYGLGATLYAVLTGKAPYDGPTPQAVLDAVRRQPPPAARTVNPAVPAALEAVVTRAMSRRPEDRYLSADDLARDVRAWLADEPLATHRDGFATRAARWGRRHRTASVAASLVLLTATVGLATGAVLLAAEQRKTVAEKGRAEGAAAAAEDLVREVAAGGIKRLPPGPAGDLAGQDVALLAADGFVVIGGLWPDRPAPQLGTAALHRAAGQAALNDWRTADAADHFRRAITLIDADPAAVGRPDVRRELAEAARMAGRLSEADALLDEAHALSTSDLSRGYVLTDRAYVAYQRGETGRAKEHAQAAVGLLAGDPKSSRAAAYAQVKLCGAHALLAVLAREVKDFDAARTAHNLAADAVNRVKVNPHVLVDDWAFTGSVAMLEMARTTAVRPPRPDDTEPPRERAVKMLNRVLAEADRLADRRPYTWFAQVLRAEAKFRRGELTTGPAAVADFAAAAKELERLTATHPGVPSIQHVLGELYTARDRADPAGGWRAKARTAFRTAAERESDDPRHAAALAGLTD